MEIAGILKITLLAAFDIGVSFSLIGEAILRAGLEVKVPDRAVIHSSVKGKEPSSAVGFNSGPATPFFNIKSITSNLELLAWIEATLALGANIFNVHGEVGLNFRFPKFSSKFTIGYGKFFQAFDLRTFTLLRDYRCGWIL